MVATRGRLFDGGRVERARAWEPRRLFLWQLAVIASLLALSAAGQALLVIDALDRPPFRGLLWLFYVDTEMRVPAIYSSLALLVSAALLALIACHERSRSGPGLAGVGAAEWPVRRLGRR